MTKVGDLQISKADEYDRPGEWVVEEYAYWNGNDAPSWAVPGWIEDRFGESGFFKTKEQAVGFVDVVTA